GFYYTYLPNPPGVSVSERPGYAEVRYHQLGTDPKSDPLVHARTGDPKTFIVPDLSRDGRWLFVYIREGWNRTDIYYRDLRAGGEEWKPFITGVQAQFAVIPWEDQFYIQTDQDAPRGRVFRASTERPAREQWTEIVPEQKDAVLDTAQVVGGRLVLNYLKNAASRIEIRELDGRPVRTVPLPGIGAASGMTGNPDEDDAYFSFASFTKPSEIFRTSIRTGETKSWASVKIPVDPSPYTVEQVWYPSKDGTRVSMFIVRRKDMPKDGSTPLLLYGYGGFQVNMLPSFTSSIYPWLEAGGAYAVPNLRGGGEYGEEWHRAGMLEKKQNVFDDFIAAAEYLVKHGYTKPERLAIRGGSNGGLLVGAAMTQRPDLFRAVVCGVPLLDMVRYHLFGSGRTWVPEYGSADDPAQFKALYAYSPYHHVKPGTRYPSLLMMSADSDDRVDPMHARKMTAAVQAATGSRRPVILRIEKNAGHTGADMVRQAVDSSADAYAFLMQELGLPPYRHP
ncbi:MAG TPA: prolyl oligopeptidase family serine peptidase, partial [Armatimonadota bacterium]|nr:prolyl oligopeptidase family serine peptidase [Armatimonadota bacterium]